MNISYFVFLKLSGERIVIELKMDCRNYADVVSRNVVAELRGSVFPEQVVLLGGHLDSWDVGQGAMDNGGGSFLSWQVRESSDICFIHTVQTINSCTSQPDVCQCLVAQTSKDNKSKNKFINDLHVPSMLIKDTFSCGVIHAQETGWQSGVWSCIMPGLTEHLMQESNVGTALTTVIS